MQFTSKVAFGRVLGHAEIIFGTHGAVCCLFHMRENE